MSRRHGVVAALLAAAAAQSCGDASAATAARESGADLSGGQATIFLADENAFNSIVPNVRSLERLQAFRHGLTLFNVAWQPPPAPSFSGLGPMFHRASCAGCHARNGRGRPPRQDEAGLDSMVIRLAGVQGDPQRGPRPLPTYGLQLADKAVNGRPEGRVAIRYTERPGRLPDGETYSLRVPEYLFEWNLGVPAEFRFSPRVAPAVIGMGLLAAVTERTLLELADPTDEDGDGISGRPNRVEDVPAGELRIGRFGWKAGQPTLSQQALTAFHEDMGITSALSLQRQGRADPPEVPELSARDAEAIAYFVHLIAVPARRDVNRPEVLRGAALFLRIGCAACHVPALETGVLEGHVEVSNQTIRPYTDLLLHDLGEDLADGITEFLAAPSEWRTPPLWGLGLIPTVNGHDELLHDGRARGTQEAILWHGGEATAAREAYVRLPRPDRRALLAFLRSL